MTRDEAVAVIRDDSVLTKRGGATTMGSVFVNGAEQGPAGQTEGPGSYAESIAGALGLVHERTACGHAECRVGSPCSVRREFRLDAGSGLAVLCVGDGEPTNYYKVHHATLGRTVVYLFSGGQENDALELARREAESARPKMGALSVLRPTPLSSRSGVDAVLWRP